MKRSLTFFIFLAVSFVSAGALADFCQKRTQGFSLQKICSSSIDASKTPSQLAPLPKDLPSLQKILHQPFYYLKKGQQCFVFLSEDQRYVLKFLRWDKLEPPFWTKWVSTSKTQQLINARKQKQTADFTSYLIAARQLSKETKLVYLHLKKTDFLQTPLKIFDRISIEHHLQADDMGFILQERVDPFLPLFLEKLQQGLETSLQPFLIKLLDLLESRIAQEISDSDITLQYNMGIHEGEPVLFDIGNLQKKASISLKEETKLILEFLREKSPLLARFFEQ